MWIKLRTLAVLWTFFNAKNAKKTAGPRQFYGHFSNVVTKTSKTAGFVVLIYSVGKVSIKLPRSGSFFYMSIKLPRSAVFWTLQMKMS